MDGDRRPTRRWRDRPAQRRRRSGALDPRRVALAVLRRRRGRDRGEPAGARRRPARERREDPARAQGLLDVEPRAARRALPRGAPARAACTRRASAARSTAARSTPSPRPTRKPICARSSRSPTTSCSTPSRSGERFQPLVRAARAAPAGAALRPAGQSGALRGQGPALRSRRALARAWASRRSAVSGRSRRHQRAALPHPVRSRTSRRSQRTVAAFEEKFGEFIPRHGVDQLRRRPPHHAPRLPGRRPGAPASRLPATVTACRSTSSRARRSRSSAGVLVAEVLDLPFNGMPHRDPRHLGDLPHARRARDALPAAHHRRGRTRRAPADLPPRRPDLPRRRRDRRLLVSPRRCASAAA